MLPLRAAVQIDQKGAKQGDFSASAQFIWQGRGCVEWRVQVSVCCEGSGLRIRKAGGEHLSLFKARQSPLLWSRSNLREGKVTLSPHLLQDRNHLYREDVQNRQVRLKWPL